MQQEQHTENSSSRRWLFGDQLGPHFLDHPEQPVLIIESRAVFRRRRFRRQKAHLVLSAMRHRAAELGDRCEYIRSDTYRPAAQGPLTVCHPTSRAALALAQSMPGVEVLPARGFATPMEDFRRWADSRGGRRLLMEDFYRENRRRLRVLMDGEEPTEGRWNFDAENRERAPRSGSLDIPEPLWPVEDEIDEGVRRDLDRWVRDGDVSFVGVDGPRRFAATNSEALAAFAHFLTERLDTFGPFEDAMLSGDPWMAHSLMSAALNLGLVHPLELVTEVEQAYHQDRCAFPRPRDSFVSSSAGATMSGICIGIRTTTTGSGTSWPPMSRCRSGSAIWTLTQSKPVVCRAFSVISGTTAGFTTFPG